MAGRGRGAWKPKTVGAQFAQQASEDLGMKLGSAMKVRATNCSHCSSAIIMQDKDRHMTLLRSAMSPQRCSPRTNYPDLLTMNTTHILSMPIAT